MTSSSDSPSSLTGAGAGADEASLLSYGRALTFAQLRAHLVSKAPTVRPVPSRSWQSRVVCPQLGDARARKPPSSSGFV